MMVHSKIAWKLESNSQKENALASFRQQRVLITQHGPSRVVVKCDACSDDFKHLIAADFFLTLKCFSVSGVTKITFYLHP
jgi:hypothetical protein